MTKIATYSSLVGINLLYACVTLFTKYASQQEFCSWEYCLGLIGAICVIGIIVGGGGDFLFIGRKSIDDRL